MSIGHFLRKNAVKLAKNNKRNKKIYNKTANDIKFAKTITEKNLDKI